MLSALFLSVIAAAETPVTTKQSADVIQTELPKAQGEGQAPAGAADLEREMKGEQQTEESQLRPGEKKETKDWADEERWGRYPEGPGGQLEPGEKKVTKDWADEERWKRYQDDDGAGPAGDKPDQRIRSNREKGSEWPRVLRRRSPGSAFALGAVLGFGAGHYYAGEANRGLMFSVIDAVLVAGFVATTVAMNQLVIDHDFKTGRSLARDERPMGHREGQLYVASVICALAEIGSHVFQGIGAMQAARRTNGVLDGVTFVPVEAGAVLGARLSF